MKDSGIPWIGEIPEEWGCNPIGQYFKCRNEKVSDKDFPPLSVTKNGILPQLDNVAKTNANDDRKLVRKGDFVINSRSDRKQSCGIAMQDGSVSLINIVLNPFSKDICSEYIKYAMKNQAFAEEFYRWGYGIVADLWTTRWDMMKRISIPLPPLPEQQAIAAYLDTKCKEIDELVAIQEKMIEELKAYRQSVITEAVTKGLNPNAPRKDSGIEWIGKVPEGWEKDKISRIFNVFGSGTTPKGEEYYTDEEGIPWINSGDLNFGYIDEAKKYVSYSALKECPALKLYEKGALMIAMYGASIGKLAITNIECCTNQACFVMNHNKKSTNQKYLFYQLYSFENKWIELGFGGTQPNISAEKIKQTWLVLPPLSEQQSIVSYLDTKCKEIDKLIGIKQKKIETLKQYRQSIIFEAVTGKK